MSSETSTKTRRKGNPPAVQTAYHGRQPGGTRVEASRTAPGQVPDNGVRPWHLFVVGTLAASSAGALVTQGTRPANIVLVCLAIVAAGATGYGLYRTLWPLVASEADGGPEMVGGRTRAALEREKLLVLRAIKDLEFDRAMGKVAEADFQDMTARLRTRAMRLIRQLDTGAAGYRELIERELGARLGRIPAPAPASAGSDAGAPPGAPVSIDEAPVVQPDDRARPSIDSQTVPGPRAPLETHQEGTAGPLSDAAGASVTCPGCRTLNDPDARFCKTCGTRLTVLA
jgi:hypothetical protein